LEPWQEIDYDVSEKQIIWGDLIGKGNFSKVFKGMYKGEIVAIKKHVTQDETFAKYLFDELAILKRIHHDGLVGFKGAGKLDEKTTLIVTEYVAGGDLRMLLQNFDNIGWKMRVSIMKGVADALLYLHDRDLLHRDMKTENIMLDLNLKPKLIDLGFARKIAPDKHMTMCGTDEFMAPEVMFGMEYDYSSDIFSFGIILAEVSTKKVPGKEVEFLDRTPMNGFCVDWEEMEAELNKVNTPDEMKALIGQCAADEPGDRITTDALCDRLGEMVKGLQDEGENITLDEDKIMATIKQKWENIMKYGDKQDSKLLLDADDLSSSFFTEEPKGNDAQAEKMRARRKSVRRAMETTIEPKRKGGATIFRTGFLYKRSGWRRWQKLYFKITDETGLVYYEKDSVDARTPPKGVLFFDDMLPPKKKTDVAFISNALSRKKYSFMVMKNDHKAVFAAMSDEDAADWVRRINRGYIAFRRQGGFM